MIDFPGRRLAALLAAFVAPFLMVALAATQDLGGVAQAQQASQPTRLSIPKRLQPARSTPNSPAAAMPALQGYRARSAGRSVSGIQVNKLGAVAADAAGVLTGGDGGFDANLWEGSQSALIKRLLAAHPERVSSQVLRDLLRRVLLSAATPPAGAAGSGFTAVRLRALMAMGAYGPSLDLLKAMPRQNRESDFMQIETELKLVTGKVVPACRSVATEVTRRKESFWQKALVYCQLLAGDHAKAEFGLTLLRETETDDPLFLELADGIVTGQVTEPKNLANATLLHFAMLKSAKTVLPIATARRFPAALMALAGDAASENRIEAIEVAANDGLLAGDDLIRRYEAALPPAGLSAVDEAAPQTAVDRSRLYRAGKRARIPTSKAEALSQAMKTARDDGRMGGVARLFRPILAAIPPSNDLLWVAPVAFRMSLLNGDFERAGIWLALARRHAAISAEAGQLYRDMAPLGALLVVNPAVPQRAPELAGQPVNRAIQFYSLFKALGGTVGFELMDGLIFRTEQVAPLPDPILWMRLRQLNAQKIEPSAPSFTAAQPLQRAFAAVAPGSGPAQKVVGPAVIAQALPPPSQVSRSVGGNGSIGPRLGERLLLMILAIGDRPLEDVSPVVIGEIVYGLRQAGLPDVARALSMEAAINAGL